MKKLVSLFLTIVMVFTLGITAFASAVEESDFGAYKSVVIIGVDGAGAFFNKADTPSFDRIFADDSAVSESADAETVTISAQNWGAILLGVSYLKHGLTNEILDNVERTSNETYPSIFRLARENNPSAVLASFCNWNPINFGLIENDIDVYKDTADDKNLCDKIVDYLENNNPQLLFVQFDSVDGAGHSTGYGSEEYLETLSTVDGYIGRVYDTIEAKGAADDTLFIVVSDHGGTPGVLGGGGSHGGLTAAERKVTLAVRGKTVNDCIMTGARNRDVAAIALYALGIEKASEMTAEVPVGLFDNKNETVSENVMVKFIRRLISYLIEIFSSLGIAC